MSTAEEVNCPDNNCPDTGTDTGDGSGGTGAEVTKQTFCPFKHTLCVGSDGSVTISDIKTPYDDGNYNQLTIVDGCLTNLQYATPRGYVAPACCPKSDSSTGGSTDVALAVSDKQLTQQTSAGLLTQVHWAASTGYSVTGCGTTANPFVLSGPTIPSTSLNLTPCANNDHITVTGDGSATNPLKICHKKSPLAAGEHCGVVTDSSGHVIGINPYTSNSLTITPDCRIEKKGVTAAQTVPFAGGSIEINEFGEIINITPPAGLSTVIQYTKADGSFGSMTFTDGILTGQT